MKQPDARLHFGLSIVKSIIRIIAFVALCYGSLYLAGAWLIVAELIGIGEELV